MSIWVYSVLGTEIFPYFLDASFHVSSEESSIGKQVVIMQKMLQSFGLAINMLDSFINSVLTNVFTRKHKSIMVCNIQRHSIMSEIN